MGKRVLVTGIAFIIFLALTNLAVAAGDPETQTVLKGGKIISVEEAKKLFDQKGAAFIDTRTAMNYGKGHIPGAKLVVYKGKSENRADFDESKDEFELAKLPPDKNTPVVFYGHGATGWKAYKAAIKAIKGEYKNVQWFRGGMEEWEKKGYPKE